MKSLPRSMKQPREEYDVKPFDFFAGFQISRPEEEPEEDDAEEEQSPYGAHAATILEEAEQKAENILRDAREQAEILRKEAYEEGLREGRREGHHEAYEQHQKAYEQERAETRASARALFESVSEEKTKILEKYIDDLKRVSLAVAEKIIQTSLQSSGDIVKRMILSATDKMTKRQWAKIYIAKSNVGLSMEADTEFLEALSRLSDNVKVITMDQEEEGTCIIELPDEIIDASVGTQIENIKDIINNARV